MLLYGASEAPNNVKHIKWKKKRLNEINIKRKQKLIFKTIFKLLTTVHMPYKMATFIATEIELVHLVVLSLQVVY